MSKSSRPVVFEEYVGIFSGLQFSRTQVKAIMTERGMSDSDIIHVMKVNRDFFNSYNGDGEKHSHVYLKKIKKSRNKTEEVERTEYFIFRVTGHSAARYSVAPMPARSFVYDEEWGWMEWVIPQSARDDNAKKKRRFKK